MEHYKRVTKYWRDSLVDKQFSQGKYKSSDLEKTFLLNDKNAFFRVNNKNVLQSVISFEDNLVETSYIPFSFKKITNHNTHEQDYRPEILLPIIFKIQVSENGFIYPIEKPVIPRDLLLPLDKEDFFLGNMEDYDLYVTKNSIPTFEFSETSEWEEYYANHIEAQYQKELIAYLQEENIINDEEAQVEYKKIIKYLSSGKKTKKKFLDTLSKFNEEWSKTIGEQLKEDPEFIKSIESYLSQWSEYLECIYCLLKEGIKSKEALEGYEKIDSEYFTKGEIDIASKITAVYEDIYTRDKMPALHLFRNYTTIEEETEIPVMDSNAFFSKRLGHNNNQYPLADAQRIAVSALIDAKPGEILPVNGPPGTGKTTMLLSVVACLWVENAVNETGPPVIIANSTNNQAVTNIIDAFAKDFSRGEGHFAGRWIDNIHSFGSYFVSSMRATEARDKGYLTEEAVKEMETEDFYIKAKKSFLEKSQQAFDKKNITVEESVRKLHSLLIEKKKLLEEIEKTYFSYHESGKHISKVLGIDYTCKEAVTGLGETLGNNKKEIEIIEDKWERYLASESIFLSAFSFLPFVRKKRNLKAKVFAKENHFSAYLQIENLDAGNLLADIKNKKESILSQIQKYDGFIRAFNDCVKAVGELGNEINPNSGFIEIDKKADIQIRFEMFLIATHYWEGQWLHDMEKLIGKGHQNNTHWKYEYICKNNWKRRMKLTPCTVMTSYMLPAYFSFSRKILDGNNKMDYLYDFIDLLIVDEAGQVSPEVAGAGFSLAKKALVIGDTKQIPPISKLTKSIDIGNLHKADLIATDQKIQKIDECYKELQSKGIAAEGGSVMKIAQNRSKYYPEKELERGLYLYEHRRCYDNIIAFCNELCYKGVLKPMRGEQEKGHFLPSMGYLNIEGKCLNSAGSKKNELEAKVIAGWIITNYKKLREAYNGDEIKDIVAVVTPFREQSRKIAGYLKQSRDTNIQEELSKITVGTVHSLQGAERKVVLFSPTYSKHNKGNFIDYDKSMLNVAVSRAKDSFLVFGDMSLFNSQSVSPTGLLANYLFEDEDNELSYEYQYSKMFAREDLDSKEHPLEILTDHAEHDAFLKRIFAEAAQRIIIISPWLLYSTIEKNGYDRLLSGKKVKITIYTNKKFNTYTLNKPDQKKEKEFNITLRKLNELGVVVKIKSNIHSKIVIKDNDTMCIGSFNWFSAQRAGQYCNTEHSIVYRGEGAKDEIENMLKQLT